MEVITLDRNARKPLEPVLHQVIDELRLSSPGRQIDAEYAIDVPVTATGHESGNSFPISSGTLSAMAHPTNLCAFVQQPKDGLFKLSVANGGEPIPEAAMGKLFEPFFRGEVRASRQGLGLGLHIASQIEGARRYADRDFNARGNPVHFRDATSIIEPRNVPASSTEPSFHARHTCSRRVPRADPASDLASIAAFSLAMRASLRCRMSTARPVSTLSNPACDNIFRCSLTVGPADAELLGDQHPADAVLHEIVST